MNDIFYKACYNCVFSNFTNECEKGKPIWDDMVYWTQSCENFKNKYNKIIRQFKLERLCLEQ